jgi:hypothetical protein
MKQVAALDGGTLKVPALTTAYLPTADEYNFFIHSRCYLLAEGQTAAELRVTFAFGAENTVWRVYPDVNGKAYIPLNDLFAFYFQRQSLNTIGVVGVYGNITVDALDRTGTILDTVGLIANIYDCSGVRGGYISAGFDHLLPDTFRVPAAMAYNDFVNVGCRLTRGVNLVQLNSGGNDYQYWQQDAGGEAVGVNLHSKGQPAYIRAYEDSSAPDPSSMVGEARFELVSCMDDKLLLTWWSVEDGIYKSRVADIVGGGASQRQATDYIHDFDDRTAKDADTFTALRFASLSQRDYEYYRDLLISDEVYIIAPVDTADGMAEITRVPCKVDGGVPTRKEPHPTTIDFNIIINEYSEL